uniref:4-hydroxyisophthalic acid decarboxylase n=1 Tax=Cystobasidium slooffiae TaxID=106018 RepID=A0AA48GBU3_9BASI|nr:4-hydroxyisophthalic acid decarboxylase [Cystobasidium slooffiae]
MRGKIILEEAWNLPRLSWDAVNFASPEGAKIMEKAMPDIVGRIKEMDETGIELQVLSFTSPGPQISDKAAEGEALAREANDWVAEQCKNHPGRFANFAAICMINPQEAAKEARRCVEQHNFVGIILNDYQNVCNEEAPEWAETGPDPNGKMLYYDHPSYDVLWETLQELEVSVYLHPRLHHGEFYKKRPWLAASAHGFKTQLASHILAMCTSGIFDRFPKLQMMFGHMGEGITADLWRLDHKLDRKRFPTMPMSNKKLMRDYFANNIHITTSGHYSTRMMQACISELGADRIQFAIDYPYEPKLSNGATWMDTCPISESDRLKIARTNAIKLLKLDRAPFNLKLDATMEELNVGGLQGHVFGIGQY